MKNLDYVSKMVAKEENLPEKLVSDINRYFWRDVKKKVYAHQDAALYIREIGTLVHSMRRIRTEILWLIARIRILKKTRRYTFKRRDEELERNYKFLRILLKHHNYFATMYYYDRIKRWKRITENRAKKKQNEQMARISEIDSQSIGTSDGSD